jgi:hypothetical protein
VCQSTTRTCFWEKWFLATLLLYEGNVGLPSSADHRSSYKTPWYLCHRIRVGVKEADKPMLEEKNRDG